MRTRCVWLALLFFLPLSVAAQTPVQAPAPDPSTIISMNQEPHHHLVLHNDYVNIFDVRVTPGDSIVLHRHNDDTIAIAIGNQDVTVGVPGKPDVHQKNTDGQVRLQRGGYIHSTRVEGSAAYHTVAVELLHAQDNLRNLCSQVIAGLPLNCPEASPGTTSEKEVIQPQLESDQTRVQLVRVLPHRRVDFGHASSFQLIVALDPGSLSPGAGQRLDQELQPGNFVWFDKGGPARTFKNNGDKDARLVVISLNPIVSSANLPSVPADQALPPVTLAAKNNRDNNHRLAIFAFQP